MTQKTTSQLINNAIGQLEGVNRMIESKEDCFKVLIQIKAAKAALESASTKYLSENFVERMNCCEEGEQAELCKKFMKELI